MSLYPIGYEADYAVERSRLTTFFRGLLSIPLALMSYVYGIAMLFTWIIAGLAVLFTARYPEGLYRFNSNVVRWFTRYNGYARLLTDVYPPFDLGEHTEYPVRVPIAPALERYSRLKVFFRGILGIPVGLIMYALMLLSTVAAVCSWFVILFTGKQPEGLQDAQNLSVAYQARAWGYFLYLTETWPPFSAKPDPAGAVGTEQPAPAVS